MSDQHLKTPIAGLHHVTAISGPAQENLDFYTKALKTRLIKKTVNFDAPEMYHLYFGAQDARPGSVMTFFNREERGQGQAGAGFRLCGRARGLVRMALRAGRQPLDPLWGAGSVRDRPARPGI